MWQLVQFQMKNRWKQDVFILALLIGYAVLIKHIDIVVLAMPILLIRATSGSQKLYFSPRQLLAMPVLQTDVIKARFMYEALSYYLIIITLTILMVIKGDTDAFNFFTSLIIVFNTLYAQAIYVEFSTIANPSYIDYVFGIIHTIGFIIVHFIFLIFDFNFLNWPLMLIMPLLSFAFLKHYYNKAQLQLPQKDLIA